MGPEPNGRGWEDIGDGRWRWERKGKVKTLKNEKTECDVGTRMKKGAGISDSYGLDRLI